MLPTSTLVPMRPSSSPSMSGAHCSDGFEVETPWHHHDMHQLLYAFDGSVEVEGQQGHYKVPHQFAVWIPAGAVHRTTIQRVASGSVFLKPEMLPSTGSTPRVIAAPPLLREMVKYAMRWPLVRDPDEVSDCFFDCFAKLCQGWLQDEIELVLPTSSDARIRSVMEFTIEGLESVTLDDVCGFANMSERTFRRRFREAAGLTWAEFRLRAKMCAAIDGLERSNKPVGVLAADLGYDNQAAFARAFRAFTGVSPSVYRQQNRGWA